MKIKSSSINGTQDLISNKKIIFASIAVVVALALFLGPVVSADDAEAKHKKSKYNNGKYNNAQTKH